MNKKILFASLFIILIIGVFLFTFKDKISSLINPKLSEEVSMPITITVQAETEQAMPINIEVDGGQK